MIEFRNVTRRFGSIEAVRDLDFSIDRGDVVGLLGSNGAGKTTTMRLMTGYFPPSEGQVRIAGHSVQDDPLGVKRRIGYLPETPPLHPEMVVRRYLRYIAELKEIPPGDQPAKIDKVLERLELVEQADRLVGNLSRGYKQRVALAQALVHEPEILVLDEPTLGLDPKQVRRLRGLIQELARDSTLIISSHILPEVREICQRVIILSEGEMVAVDTPEELALKMAHGQTWSLQVEDPSEEWEDRVLELEALRKFEPDSEGQYQVVFDEQDREGRRELFRLCCEEDVPLVSLQEAQLDLEEIFLELTRDQEEREAVANEPS